MNEGTINERMNYLYSLIEKQQNQIEYLTNIIEIMQSPNYLRNQLELIDKDNIKSKIDFINKIKNNPL